MLKFDRGFLLWYRKPTDGEAAVAVYIDRNDWWIGYYRGKTHRYVCPLPTIVICWRRW